MSFDDCAGIHISGVRVIGAGWRSTAGNSGILGSDCRDILIKNVEVHGVTLSLLRNQNTGHP